MLTATVTARTTVAVTSQQQKGATTASILTYSNNSSCNDDKSSIVTLFHVLLGKKTSVDLGIDIFKLATAIAATPIAATTIRATTIAATAIVVVGVHVGRSFFVVVVEMCLSRLVLDFFLL